MGGNLFQGSIPLSFRSLKSLEILDLSQNILSGPIPKELQGLSELKVLNLSFNHLEGEVPMGGVFRNLSAISITGNNKLCGGIPEIHLPTCLNKESKEKRNIQSVKVIIAIVFCILLGLTIFLVTFWRRKHPQRKPVFESFLGDAHLRVQYKDLFQATSGFASSSLIGMGGFGHVYKGFLHQLGKLVAIKVLNLQNHGALKSFVAECKTLGKVRHRNLLNIITCCSSLDFNGNDFKALVFDFMSNGNLDSWIHVNDRSRNLNLLQRLDVAIDVAYALDYLHYHCEPPIVHCDLKPNNVLLDDDMVAHVGDFGLAKLLFAATNESSGNQSSSAAIRGTIGYVAPEYGMGGTTSVEGDIYSYGILLLEMVTAKRPTDAIFYEGFNLHDFSKMALPKHVNDIVDPHLVQEFDEERNNKNDEERKLQMWECLTSIVRIGISCSSEISGERMNIKDIIIELCATKAKLLRGGTSNFSKATRNS